MDAGDSRPLNRDTVFEIGPLAKFFTSRLTHIQILGGLLGRALALTISAGMC